MCVEITDAPKLYRKYEETWVFAAVSGQWPLGKNIRGTCHCTLRNKIQWNLNQISYIFIQENTFENIVWKMATILSQYIPQNMHTISWCFVLCWLYYSSCLIHVVHLPIFFRVASLAQGICVIVPGTITLQWRHNGHDGVSNNRRLDCLVARRSKKTSTLRATGLCEGNLAVIDWFPSQRVSNAENASIWWRHHGNDPKWYG